MCYDEIELCENQEIDNHFRFNFLNTLGGGD